MMVFISINAFSQTKSIYLKTLPKGYQINDANGNPGVSNEGDFDKDGKKDLAIILYKINGEASSSILCIFLSSNFKTDQSYQWCDWESFEDNRLDFNKDLLSMGEGNGMYGFYLDLKYNSVLKKMKVVSYTEAGENKILKLKDGKITP